MSQKFVDKDESLYVAYIMDLEKAYDRVDRQCGVSWVRAGMGNLWPGAACGPRHVVVWPSKKF